MKRILSLAFAIFAFPALAQQAGGPSLNYNLGPSLGNQWLAAGTYIAGVNAQTGTTYTVLASDSGKYVSFSNASSVAVTLPRAGTTGFDANRMFLFENKGAGAVTITPTTSTINGAATLVIRKDRGVIVVSDGTNYQIGAGGVGLGSTVLTVPEGGTGAATFTAHGVMLGEGTSALVPTAAGTNGQVLIANTGADPAFASLSQDCTVTAAGVVTCTKTNNTSFTAAATTSIGTSGATIPLLSTANTWTLAQTLTGGLAPAGGFTLSPRTMHTCDIGGNSAASAFTNQTPVATEVYIAEIRIPANVTVTGISVFNGSAVSGNMKVGLANSSGVVVATSASTAASGTNAYQNVPFTGTYAAVGPATYYVLTFYDNNTQRANAFTVAGSCGAAKQTGQTYATGFTTITPPTTFTTALGPVAGLY